MTASHYCIGSVFRCNKLMDCAIMMQCNDRATAWWYGYHHWIGGCAIVTHYIGGMTVSALLDWWLYRYCATEWCKDCTNPMVLGGCANKRQHNGGKTALAPLYWCLCHCGATLWGTDCISTIPLYWRMCHYMTPRATLDWSSWTYDTAQWLNECISTIVFAAAPSDW